VTEPRKHADRGPRFDWMQQTVREDPEDVWETLAGTLGADVETGRGLNGYHASKALIRRGETLAKVLYGGPNGWPNVIASGPATDDVAPVLAGAWDRVEVTRMDSAQDFDAEGGYDRVRAQLVELHEKAGISKYELDSTKKGIRSRTIYLGSPSSRVRVRLYEKGLFEHQLGHSEASPTWFRAEVQIRPKGQPAREQAAQLDAVAAWGLSKWTQQVASAVLGADVERVTMQQRRDPDYARAMHFLSKQFSPTLRRAMEVEGDWDAVGRLLGVIP
jgi:hypothetical protein